MPYHIRSIASIDIPHIQMLYAHYVLNTTLTQESVVPSLDQLAQLISDVLGYQLPFLTIHDADHLLGFAYAYPFYPNRSAYQRTVIFQLFIHEKFQGLGLGQDLFDAFEAELRQSAIRQLLVQVPSTASNITKFLKDNDFTITGTMTGYAYKFDRAIDLYWFSKRLN